ncbi:MAG TPA: M2 family metallopeptidase [Tepidisphaeraceae bacterium]|nr:M2 family metallopeptidase [Tepidisphaeraceae bacterium]
MTLAQQSILIGIVVLMVIGLLSPLRLAAQEQDPADRARRFVAEHQATIRPLEMAAMRTAWDANISGKDADYDAKEKAQNQLDAALANPSGFTQLRDIRQALHNDPAKADALLLRQIDLLYLQYLEKQLDPALLAQITAKASAVEKAFNVYRAKVDGQDLSQSAVTKVLKTSKDSAYRKRVWEASKAVGPVVEQDLKQLIALRNQAARKLGFTDYYDMQLQLNEQSKDQVFKLFDELYELTAEPFQAAKREIDAKLASDCGITPAELRPWHYQDLFFQEAPAIYTADLDALYAKADIVKLSREFYAGIGLPVDHVLARSDLFEKPGKNPHASCWDLDWEGDVRVLANIVPDEYWMGTMLHELGHSVYGAPYIPKNLSYVLRSPAHIFTTEGIAMMMERFSKRADWMQAMNLPVPDPKAVAQAGEGMRRNQLLIFAAWSQVMSRFERAMYENPDQDLNKLWWDLVEKYQQIHRPEDRNAPDYAAKIHIVSSPAYYHNYIMGEMFASQLHRVIARDVLKTDPKTALYNGHKEVGQFLQTKVFAPGRTLRWDAFVRFATGAELSPKALVEDLKPQ